MPYNVDSDLNKENAHSPSMYTFENQLIYRLASLEATLTNSLKRIDEKIDRYQTDANQKYTDNAAQIARVAAVLETHKEATRAERDKIREDIEKEKLAAARRLEEHKIEFQKKIDPIESWRRETMTRVSLIAGLITVGWVLFGDVVQKVLGVN